MSAELFIIGVCAGLAYMMLWGVLDGLFGKGIIYVIFAFCCLVFLVLLAVNSPSGVANNILPLQYWLGFIVGSVVGAPGSWRLEKALKDDTGRPLIPRLLRGVIDR
jgi:hypothetical protein